MTDLEIQQHLKDYLFHEVHKHFWDSIKYLYSTPRTSYLQLMVATWKVESQNEEIWDIVRTMAAVATNSGEGVKELRQQTALMMATLTKAGQGTSPAGTPSSPRERDRGTHSHPSSQNSWTSLGQTTPDCSKTTGYRTGATISRNPGQNSQGTILDMKVNQQEGPQLPPVF